MVFVTITSSNTLVLSRASAGPENTPCTQIAYTLDAPASISLHRREIEATSIRINPLVGGQTNRAARVGHVIDENRHTIFHITHENHSFNFVGTFAFFVNQCKVNIESIGDRSDTESENDGINASSKIFGYRFAPPASGLTTHDCCQLGICSRMYLRIAGSANRLSTGMSKKP
jgi:hypothetical protein